MRRLLALGALLLMQGPVARADSFTATQYAGTGGDNSTGTAADNGMQLGNVYAGSFYVTDSAYTSGAFIAFTAMWSSSTSFAAGPEKFDGILSTGGVSNQLAYLITQVMAQAEEGSPTNAEAAAIQLAIWQLTSSTFKASSVTSDQTVLGFVSDIGTLLAGNSVTTPNSPFSQFQAYSSSTTYDSSSVFLIDPTSGDYQALIGVDPPRRPRSRNPRPWCSRAWVPSPSRATAGSDASGPDPGLVVSSHRDIIAIAGRSEAPRRVGLEIAQQPGDVVADEVLDDLVGAGLQEIDGRAGGGDPHGVHPGSLRGLDFTLGT